MIITYFRSSSYNAHNMCPQQYFIEYNLGWRGLSGQKADKGTIVHKVLEILAFIKMYQQDEKEIYEDDIAGNINVNNYDLSKIKSIVYDYYVKNTPHHKWYPRDERDCSNWVDKAITFNGGMFDPRNRKILYPEQHFDFEIKKPWAKFDYETKDEGNLSGYLSLKGTVDLITTVNDDTIEMIDWKTGRRLDWATGEEKTQEKLERDPQLKIYHYAIRHLYPNIKNVIFSIYFINDGGPFSICFEDSELADTENMIRNKFNEIRRTQNPELKKSWKCNKLCHFGKTTFEETSIKPTVEYRENQVCNMGQVMTKCEQIKHDTKLYGIDAAVNMYKHPNHSFGKYKAPGSTE